ncbi:MAG: AMP-binding protein [bacterium]|nr:AMP-binding protein [bacterium]
MTNDRKERLRKALIRKKVLADRRTIDKFLAECTSLNNYFKMEISTYGDLEAITDTYNKVKMTYTDVESSISSLSAFIQSKRISKGDFVDIFTENNGRWAIVEQASMRCGAVCTLRGSNAPVEELDYIIAHSDAKALIIKDGILLNKLKPFLGKYSLNFIIIMFRSEKDDLLDVNCPVYYFEDAVEQGKKCNFIPPEQNIDEPCLMLYTSGTTGNPKGVLITHKNILGQIPSIKLGFMSKMGENTLQILPVWHSYEQIAQLYYFMSGCHLHFTTLTGLRNDLIKYDIDTLMSVPRIWEAMRLGIFQKLKQTSIITYKIFDFAIKTSINYKIHRMYSERRITNKKGNYHLVLDLYHKLARLFLKPFHMLFTKTLYKQIKDKAGINFRASISGGGALSMKDQLFYDAIGVNLREGYGLTESSPVLTLRNVGDLNFLGSSGRPILGTEIKVLDIETGEELGIFQKGVVYARGYQIMKGYYKDEESTKAVLSDDGWLNTGDIGWLTADNNLVLVGRMKETIVLSNGENVEPVPIEEACLESPYIDQIMLVGQDKVSIGALVVPSEAALEKCGILANELKSGTNLTITNPTLRELLKKEISTYIKNKQNLKPFEQIKSFEVIKENFTMANGMMSQTAKMKRNFIFEKYQTLISNMFDKK